MNHIYEMQWPGLVVFIGFIVLMIFDLFLVIFRGTGSTVSNWMVQAGFKSPLWVFVFGTIVGHLLFYVQDTACPDHFTNAYKVVYFILLGAVGWIGYRLGRTK